MFKETVEKVKSYLRARQMAYIQTFNPESPVSQVVLKDLAKFCRAHKSTFHQNDRAHAVLEGRREVWLRIQQHLNLTDEQLWNLYGKDN